MKKRAFIPIICLALAVGLSVGVFAAGNLQQISAYLNSGIVIKYDGQTQVMLDAAGERVYPITYNGTTYVPVRGISTILGVPVSWDGPTQSVLLGENPTGKDFINDLNPYDPKDPYEIVKTKDGRTATIAGKAYDHYIEFTSNSTLYYDLAGQYETLTFDVYCGSNYGGTLVFTGDEDEVLDSITVASKKLPVTYTVNVKNVQQLKIRRPDGGGYGSGSGLFIFNTIIK